MIAYTVYYENDDYFDKLYLQVEAIAEFIGVTYIEPRPRKMPSRFKDTEEYQFFQLAENVCEIIFNDIIDLIIEALQSRFSHQTCIECLNYPQADNIPDLAMLASYFDGDFNAELLVYRYTLLAKSLELSQVQNIGVHKIYLKEGLTEIYPNMHILF